MRRYSKQEESPISMSYLDLKAKQLATTKGNYSNSQSRNPQIELLKLPALNSMRRSASISATERNTKFKLQNLDDKLEQLAADVRNTRLDAQQTLLHIRYLKDNLAGKQIERIREDLKKQAKGLERIVHSTISADEQRYKVIRQDCGELWNQTESLRSTLFELKMRTDHLDERMGFKFI